MDTTVKFMLIMIGSGFIILAIGYLVTELMHSAIDKIMGVMKIDRTQTKHRRR